MFRHLQRGVSRCPPRAEHEHRFASAHSGTVNQGVPGSSVADRKHRRFGEIESLRQPADAAFGQDRFFSEKTAPAACDHCVTYGELG